jgi:putative acetyltransferase
MSLRPYDPADAEALAAAYRAAVTGLGPAAYGPEHVAVWASYPADLEEFRARLMRGITMVAEAEGRPVGFAQLDPLDHVQFLYVDPAFGRRGFATALYTLLELFARQSGAAALTTAASRVSRPFFEKMGFEAVEPEYVPWGGLTFERFVMRKALSEDDDAPFPETPA